MITEYTFPDPKDQKQKEEIKGALMGCATVEERKTIFFVYVLDKTYRRPVICQALKECGLKDNLTFKTEVTKCKACKKPLKRVEGIVTTEKQEVSCCETCGDIIEEEK